MLVTVDRNVFFVLLFLFLLVVVVVVVLMMINNANVNVALFAVRFEHLGAQKNCVRFDFECGAQSVTVVFRQTSGCGNANVHAKQMASPRSKATCFQTTTLNLPLELAALSRWCTPRPRLDGH
jgi:hypothetical protein